MLVYVYTICLMLWNCRLPADIRLVVYTEGARTEEGWDFLMELYRYTMYPSEKSHIKAALAYSPLAHKLEWLVQIWILLYANKTTKERHIETNITF